MSLTCQNCKATNLEAWMHDLCADCGRDLAAKYLAKMETRQNPAQFDLAKLVNVLLTQHWMHECEIIPNYMPKRPDSETRPTCCVRYVYDDGSETFLRYSKGPLQGYFWDVYGEDMYSPEMALVAISNAPAPREVSVVATHGK